MDRYALLQARDSLTRELRAINLSISTCVHHKDMLTVDLAATDAEIKRLEAAERECSAKLKKTVSLIEAS
jgi:hypothetical protein